MSGPDRIWAWAWETNPQMGHWTTVQHIVGDGVEYVRIDEVNAIIAAADRRTEMHECAMEERDDCIEDWSKANDQICRLTAELDAMRAALKPITAQDAALILLDAVRDGLDPFDASYPPIEALAVKHAGNMGDGVIQLEIAEEFFTAALRAIAGGE